MANNDVPISRDAIWGARAIALELFASDHPKFVKKTFYLLSKNLIPARKIGAEWIASRHELKRLFHSPL